MPRAKKVQSTRTLAEIQKEMQALEAEAEAVRAKEVSEVIARIKDAITFYSLTPTDLFGGKTKASPPKAAKAAKAPKTKPAAKYKDPATGKTWSGLGRRPEWFVSATANGVDVTTLLV